MAKKAGNDEEIARSKEAAKRDLFNCGLQRSERAPYLCVWWSPSNQQTK